MRAAFEAAIACSINRVDHVRVGVGSIHPNQRLIVNGLHTKFERHVVVNREFLQEIENAIGNTIGTRADSQSHDSIVRVQREIKDLSQLIDRGVGVGGWLEIRDVTADIAVSLLNSPNLFGQLIRDSL